MSEVRTKKKSRKWIIRGFIIFLVVMGLLTFFSNTIMNMTLTQVSTMQIYGSTLSSIKKTEGMVKAAVTQEIKAPGNISIDSVDAYLYSDVEKGDVIATLKTPENMKDLEEKKKALEDRKKEIEYEKREPKRPTDYYDYNSSIEMAKKQLDEARKTLEQVRNKETLIQQEKNNIANINNLINKAETDKGSLESKKQEAEGRRDEAYAALPELNDKLLQAQIALRQCITDPDDPMFDADRLTACTKAVEDAQQAVNNMNAAYQVASNQVIDYANQITAKETESTRLQSDLEEAQTQLGILEQLPKAEDAEKAVRDAEHALTTSQNTLSDAQANDSINSDKAKDHELQTQKELEDMEKEIKELEDFYALTEIKAPISGCLIACNVSRGQDVMKDEVMFEIADMESGFYIECPVERELAMGMNPGMEVRTDYCDSAVVDSIRPDPADPMKSCIVKINVTGSWLMPGTTTVTCTISTSNRQYECVVPKGAVQQDSEGDFIYILVTKNSPLGERYIARKVPVKVVAEDATSCAIEGAGISFAYCIVRTEKPIKNGEQVRLAQGESM